MNAKPDLKSPREATVVRLPKQIHYRAIPVTGRGRPIGAKRKATWPGRREQRALKAAAGPALSPKQAGELPAKGEIPGSYDELDISPVQSLGGDAESSAAEHVRI